MSAITRYTGAATASITLAAACALVPAQSCSGSEQSLLNGTVVSSAGGSLAGIPVEAHRAHSNITVIVYTDVRGEYSFPDWSEVKSGTYSLTIAVPDFDHVSKEGFCCIGG